MAKGEQKGNRESKKPKKEKVKTIAAAPSQKGATAGWQPTFGSGRRNRNKRLASAGRFIWRIQLSDVAYKIVLNDCVPQACIKFFLFAAQRKSRSRAISRICFADKTALTNSACGAVCISYR